MKKEIEKNRKRDARRARVRKNLSGTAERPRVSVFKSNKNLYLQAIDDVSGKTLLSISSLVKDFSELKPTSEGGAKMGEAFGKKLKDASITTIVFDRNGYRYHGVIKSTADGIRKAGIQF